MMEMQRGGIGIIATFLTPPAKLFNQLRLTLQRPEGLGVVGVRLRFYPVVMVFLLAHVATVLLLLTSNGFCTNHTLFHKFKERLLMSQLL